MDRHLGSLLGLAIGDALGAPLEGLKEGHIQQVFGEVTGYSDSTLAFPDRPGKWRLKGLYTDDTQQALAVTEVLAVHGQPDLCALADLYARMADEGPADAEFGSHRGSGHFFRRAVKAAQAAPPANRGMGEEVARAASPANRGTGVSHVRHPEAPFHPLLECGQPSAGNGAAMRIAPVGLYYPDDDEALGKAAIEISLMTHHDPRGIAAALAVARVVGWLVSTDGARYQNDPMEIAKTLPSWLREWETRLENKYGKYLERENHEERLHQFSDALTVLPSLMRENNFTLAAKTVIEQANAAGPANHNIAQAHDNFCMASVVMALFRALSATDFRGSLLETVTAGGDADTVGAIVGAILGARFGAEAIPRDWREELLNAEQIEVRAQALREREVDWTRWEDFIDMERILTQREIEFVDQTEGANRKLIEKREHKIADRRARAEKTAAKQPAPDLGFAPPPELWLRKDTRPESREDLDPIQAKKEKALRGRKKIAWKEERRKQNRED